MKKPEIAKRLARRSRISRGEAADQLDRVVHDILSSLRSGQPAALPGLGRFLPGVKWEFEFEREKGRRKS
jgi:nucleoid DNA-binding protein